MLSGGGVRLTETQMTKRWYSQWHKISDGNTGDLEGVNCEMEGEDHGPTCHNA